MSTPQDLTDAEFAELDELLAATPAPLNPLDASSSISRGCTITPHR